MPKHFTPNIAGFGRRLIKPTQEDEWYARKVVIQEQSAFTAKTEAEREARGPRSGLSG